MSVNTTNIAQPVTSTSPAIGLFITQKLGIQPTQIVTDDVAKSITITFPASVRASREHDIAELRTEMEKLWANRWTRIQIKFA